MVYLKLRLPGGKLKFKSHQLLRGVERSRKVPSLRLGRVYVSWWSHKNESRYRTLPNLTKTGKVDRDVG